MAPSDKSTIVAYVLSKRKQIKERLNNFKCSTLDVRKDKCEFLSLKEFCNVVMHKAGVYLPQYNSGMQQNTLLHETA